MTFRIAEQAKARRNQIANEKIPRPVFPLLGGIDPREEQEAYRVADEQARQELGDIHHLIEIGEPATIDGLMKEMNVIERLDGMINRCIKRLLMVRGVKSLSSAGASESGAANCRPAKSRLIDTNSPERFARREIWQIYTIVVVSRFG